MQLDIAGLSFSMNTNKNHKLTFRKRFKFQHLKFLIPLLILFTPRVSPSQAQGSFFWSEQKKIPNYFPIAQQPPYLIADNNNTIHAFNSQPLDLEDENSPKAIFYRQWTPNSGWTYPIDILYDDSGGTIEILDVASNSLGVVYLIYQKDFKDIYFTSAHLAVAGKSTAWTLPSLIANQSTHVSVGFEGIGAMAADEIGNIVVIYSGAESGQGLYFTFSSDHGENWSQPYPVYLTGDESIIVTDPELSSGESGMIHGVWTTFLSDGFAGPGFYASFDPKHSTWSEPMELDDPGIRTPSVIEFKDYVMLAYYHFKTNGNWWRRSFDGGKTWNSPSQLSPRHVGTNGRVSFVVDSTNTFHAFFGERINDMNHGMWQSTWLENTWAPPEAVVRGPQIRDIPGGNGFDPGAARAVISNGNLILVSWSTDGFAGVNGAWFAYKMLNVPALPSLQNVGPTPYLTLTPTSTPEKLVTIETTPAPGTLLEGNDHQPSAILLNPQTSIFSGVILALLIVTGVLILKAFTKS